MLETMVVVCEDVFGWFKVGNIKVSILSKIIKYFLITC